MPQPVSALIAKAPRWTPPSRAARCRRDQRQGFDGNLLANRPPL